MCWQKTRQGHEYFGDCCLSANTSRNDLWNNVEDYIWMVDGLKGVSVADTPSIFFYIRYRFYHSSLLVIRATLFAFQLYYSYILFVFLNAFSVVCLHFHTLPFCRFFFPSIIKFCSVKAPRKAVLFHEYQASTGRFNKFVSLLAAALSFVF